MKKITKTLISFSISLLVFLIIVVPALSLAASSYDPAKGLVPCTNTPDSNGKISNLCDFDALMSLVNNVISFALFYMAIPIAAIMFAYAGFLLVTAGGSEAKTRAKNIFTNAVIGLVLAATAWLVIRTILSVAGYQGDWIGFTAL